MLRLKLLSAILLGVLLLPLAGARVGPSAPVTVRVLTYNIHHGEGRDGELDLLRLADVMRSLQPDVIALQEVDRGTQRAGGVDQLTELAALLGMHAEYGKSMDFAGGAYGVAILSRWSLASSANRPLPASPDHEPRTALTVRFRAGRDGPWVRFTSTHLDNSRDAAERLAQAQYLNDLLATEDGDASILAGDFNARPGTDVIQVLEQGWMNALPDSTPLAPTIPADAPPAPTPTPTDTTLPARPPFAQRRGPRGDFVLFRPAHLWRVIESRTIDESVASDHRPVLTMLEFIGG